MLSTIGAQVAALAALMSVRASLVCMHDATAVLSEEFPQPTRAAVPNHAAVLFGSGAINWTVPDSRIIPESTGSVGYEKE
jgi:hypothetical protein